jgi:putative cupin region
MRFTVNGETKDIVAGDVVYLAPGARHALEALEPCHMALTLVDVSKSGHAVEGEDGGE